MSSYLNIVGIMLCSIGALIGSWFFLKMKTSADGTRKKNRTRQRRQQAEEQRRQVLVGLIFSFLGTLLQILGQIIHF